MTITQISVTKSFNSIHDPQKGKINISSHAVNFYFTVNFLIRLLILKICFLGWIALNVKNRQ